MKLYDKYQFTNWIVVTIWYTDQCWSCMINSWSWQWSIWSTVDHSMINDHGLWSTVDHSMINDHSLWSTHFIAWKGGWFWLFTYFTAIESLKMLFIAVKCVKSRNHPPCYTIKFVDHRLWSLIILWSTVDHRLWSLIMLWSTVDHRLWSLFMLWSTVDHRLWSMINDHWS